MPPKVKSRNRNTQKCHKILKIRKAYGNIYDAKITTSSVLISRKEYKGTLSSDITNEAREKKMKLLHISRFHVKCPYLNGI